MKEEDLNLQKPHDSFIDGGVYFTIKDASEQVGVVPATIRNWERQGIFSARRSTNGYRIYTVDDIQQLKTIKHYSKNESMGINAIRRFYNVDTSTNALQIPAENTTISKKLLSQKWREHRIERGFLLEDVANEINISPSYLSKIEHGQANVSYDIMKRLAAFYGENILYYINEVDEERHVVRKGEGEMLSIGIDGVSLESVTAIKKHTLSAMIYMIEPGAGRPSTTFHNGEEFIYVLAGRIQMILSDTIYIMRTGDSMSFRSTQPHAWKNCGKQTAKVLWVYTGLTREQTQHQHEPPK